MKQTPFSLQVLPSLLGAPKDTEFIVAFRTGQLYEIDMAADALKQKGMPFYMQQETESGLTLAMPAAPASGPGIWWSLLVPRPCADDARDVLKTLPINPSQEPDVWGFEPSPQVKVGWKVFVASLLVIPILMILIEKLMK
jgi:hypothetical protein